MTGNSSRVAAARPADMEPLISVMVLAFAADPVARWMYRDPQRYLAYFGRFIRAFARKAFSSGTAWCIDGNLGGALSPTLTPWLAQQLGWDSALGRPNPTRSY